MTFVIAICGTMGSGKSTAVENIAAALPDCQSLHEDDYNRTTERSLDEIKTWWDRGADVGEFDLSELIQQMAIRCPDELPSRKCQSPDLLKTDIATGQHQGTSQHQGTDVPRSPGITAPPTSGVGRGNPEILLLETHFGRLHPGLNPWIDFQCWIDVPADIAVARKIAQMSAQIQAHSSSSRTVDGLRWIENFCKGYLTTTRKLFEMQRQKVRDLSEMSIDGRAAPLDVCAEFLQRLPQKYKPDQMWELKASRGCESADVWPDDPWARIQT